MTYHPKHAKTMPKNEMNAPLVDARGGITLSGMKTELDACRRRVDSLAKELSTQRAEFETHRRDAEAQLSESRRHKKILLRAVIALRMELNEGGSVRNGEKSATEHYVESFNVSNQGTRLKSKTPDDGTIKSSNQVVGANVALMKTEEPTGDDAMEVPNHADRKMSSARKSKSGQDVPGPTKSKYIRVMQRRMALLRHASRCNAPGGDCKVSRHCAATKAVWDHIMAGCNNPNCSVKHCVSSRYVLNNYQRCKLPLSRSAICGAVEGGSRKKQVVRHNSI